jgi:hypothetical protein
MLNSTPSVPKYNLFRDSNTDYIWSKLNENKMCLYTSVCTPSVPQYMPFICQNIDVSRHVLVYRYIHFWTNGSQVFWNGGSTPY